MEKVFVAKRVAAKLRGAEHSVDAALIEASELVSELLRSRKDLGLAANVGNEALAKMTAAVSALSEARSAMVGAHAELAEVQLRIGIRTKMDSENKAEPAADTTTLREVA